MYLLLTYDVVSLAFDEATSRYSRTPERVDAGAQCPSLAALHIGRLWRFETPDAIFHSALLIEKTPTLRRLNPTRTRAVGRRASPKAISVSVRASIILRTIHLLAPIPSW